MRRCYEEHHLTLFLIPDSERREHVGLDIDPLDQLAPLFVPLLIGFEGLQLLSRRDDVFYCGLHERGGRRPVPDRAVFAPDFDQFRQEPVLDDPGTQDRVLHIGLAVVAGLVVLLELEEERLDQHFRTGIPDAQSQIGLIVGEAALKEAPGPALSADRVLVHEVFALHGLCKIRILERVPQALHTNQMVGF